MEGRYEQIEYLGELGVLESTWREAGADRGYFERDRG